MKIGIVVFPGSNCDYDCYTALQRLEAGSASYVWHKDAQPGTFDAYVVPGGFSYGDYLRCGAIARFSPVMNAVIAHAKAGRYVLGICNGFQILCEAGLLPGALYMNDTIHFICEHVYIRTEQDGTPYTGSCRAGQVLNIPIAHGEGNYFADEGTIRMLEDEGRVAFRYCTREGEATATANPNGSSSNIAGIYNADRRVLGMMPHPERAYEAALGSEDGRLILESLIEELRQL